MPEDTSGFGQQSRRRMAFVWIPFVCLAGLLLLIRSMQAADQSSLLLRHLVYLTGQHPLVPAHLPELQSVTHVAMAFMRSELFNEDDGDGAGGRRSEWPLFMSVAAARAQFAPGTKVLVAVGGWGDTAGFETAAATTEGQRRFARNIAAMVDATGADGVDIDWEYPGGNGEDYKQVPNEEKAWQIAAYPLLLGEIRAALGPLKLITAAVPGRLEDTMAFRRETLPRIMSEVNFLNVMTYDLMNRRDNVTMHHSGVANSLTAIDAYIAAGASPRKLNLGLAFYVKCFKTDHDDCLCPVLTRCEQKQVQQGKTAVGCRTQLMEDPDTGADLGRTGGFSWHDPVPEHLQESFHRARQNGTYDEVQGGYYYWDAEESWWWTFDTATTIRRRKFPLVVAARKLGGVFAWGLGEDAPHYSHFRAVGQILKRIRDGGWDDLKSEL